MRSLVHKSSRLCENADPFFKSRISVAIAEVRKTAALPTFVVTAPHRKEFSVVLGKTRFHTVCLSFAPHRIGNDAVGWHPVIGEPIDIVIFPAPEVAAKARAELRCQRLIRLHDRLVEANRKQHDLPALPLFFESFGGSQSSTQPLLIECLESITESISRRA
jgi:hypothetical protein